jgi:peptidoglycan/LPS O-acetylase OafA/YrhL
MSQAMGKAAPVTNASRSRELDALRGVAALLVVLYHQTFFIGEFVPGPLPSMQVAWGCYGVVLFFAISGFVIASSLRRITSVGEFARRRAVRLLPAYWCAMLLTASVVAATGASSFAVPSTDWPANLAMVQFWADARMIDGAYWTLNVELAFYACMAAIWRAGLLDRIEPVVGAWLMLPLLWAGSPDALPGLGMLLVAHYIPFFAIGILSARIWSGERSVTAQAPWLAATLIVLCLVRPLHEPAVGGAVTLVMLAVATGRATAIVRTPLLWLGRISYPLYLTHGVIGYIVAIILRGGGWSPDATALIVIGMSLLLADALTRFYDEPVREWFERYRPLLRPSASARA